MTEPNNIIMNTHTNTDIPIYMSNNKSIFQKQTARNVIIDPFSCLMKLSLLRFLDIGTKISISDNRINFNTPSYFQGFIRFIYGDNREHLHNLYLPIQKCVEWFWNDKDADMTYMFNNAVIGLKMLKTAYSEYATIHHTIDYYIIILMQKQSYNIDIYRITNPITNPSKNVILEPENHIESSIAITQNTQNTQNTHNTQTKHKNKNKSQEIESYKNVENILHHETGSRVVKDTIDVKDIRDSIILQQQQQQKNLNDKEPYSKIRDIHIKDMHKFLFDIWNSREINIVINLYREMESKYKGYERDNIYVNIMSYCSMKENKLNQYIESNSSIL